MNLFDQYDYHDAPGSHESAARLRDIWLNMQRRRSLTPQALHDWQQAQQRHLQATPPEQRLFHALALMPVTRIAHRDGISVVATAAVILSLLLHLSGGPLLRGVIATAAALSLLSMTFVTAKAAALRRLGLAPSHLRTGLAI